MSRSGLLRSPTPGTDSRAHDYATLPTNDKAKKSVDFRTPNGVYGKHRDTNPPSRSAELLRQSTKRSTSKQSGTLSAPLRSRAAPRTGGMAGKLDLESATGRRDRTFVGTECAVCEEPLEHTLRNERILQLVCSHVAHEACFHEYISALDAQTCPTCDAPLGLESFRGGNLLDLGGLNSLVKPGPSTNDWSNDSRGVYEVPVQWDTGAGAGEVQPSYSIHPAIRNGEHDKTSAHNFGGGATGSHLHSRNDSFATAMTRTDTPDGPASTIKRRDYDARSIETTTKNGPGGSKTATTAPNITIRSEFPTLTRSRDQQSLTCLVTVEVSERMQVALSLPPVVAPKAPAESFQEFPTRPVHRRATSRSKTTAQQVQELQERVENWHGLDMAKFGQLHLHAKISVGKDRLTWQDLECYLFSEMLICVKEKRVTSLKGASHPDESAPKFILKGSILIKKHLRHVTTSQDDFVLTLSLTVTELPEFHLRFQDAKTLRMWYQALIRTKNKQDPLIEPDDIDEGFSSDEDMAGPRNDQDVSSVMSSHMARSLNTAATEHSDTRNGSGYPRHSANVHVPLDVVVVVPVTSSMQGLKIMLLKDTLRFLISNLGERDRLGLVTFGANGGAVPIVGMTTKAWHGWPQVLEKVKPQGQKSHRSDVVDGANVAMDLLMQRKATNPLSSIIIISDSSTADSENVDFVVSRAEAAKVGIYSFGLGLTHKPDAMIELSARTKACYTYVKDWNALRECAAGCLGSLQSTSHQNVRLKLHIPEGSPAKFVKISGAIQTAKRATGKDAEAALGNLRFGDKRDVLVQLAIDGNEGPERGPHDAWESLVSGLEALGSDPAEGRAESVEEVPLIQADLAFGDVFRDGQLSHSPRPTLLAITVLPAPSNGSKMQTPSGMPSIPPHPSVVQRRMELLTSDMFTRALGLVAKGQHERAYKLLSETRSILKSLGKGRLPGQPPHAKMTSVSPPPPPQSAEDSESPAEDMVSQFKDRHGFSPGKSASRQTKSDIARSPGIDPAALSALDAELESSLEWIDHPAVFSRDSRKAVLQAIGIISTQRSFTLRTPIEALWAGRIPGIRRVLDAEKEWRDGGLDETLTEE